MRARCSHPFVNDTQNLSKNNFVGWTPRPSEFCEKKDGRTRRPSYKSRCYSWTGTQRLSGNDAAVQEIHPQISRITQIWTSALNLRNL